MLHTHEVTGSSPAVSTTSSQAAYRLRRLFYALHQKAPRAHSAAPPPKNADPAAAARLVDNFGAPLRDLHFCAINRATLFEEFNRRRLFGLSASEDNDIIIEDLIGCVPDGGEEA